MAYFWVNHKQTVKQERTGRYLWSPFRNSNGAQNKTYDSMATAQAGDVVFSYANALVGAIGTVTAQARKAPKPAEFGKAGENWGNDGWLLPVVFESIVTPLRPKAHMEVLGPLFPRRNSPIRESGDGNQSCYLAPISDALGIAILELLGKAPAETSNEEEDVTAVLESSDLTETEKQQLVQARRGQGRFRAAVLALEPKCRITGVAVAKLLRASHIKPWRDSDNRERLDGANGLMLAPHIDLLFDKGLISFSDSGKLLIANGLPRTVLAQWAIDPQITVGSFSTQQASYLQFHRKRYGY